MIGPDRSPPRLLGWSAFAAGVVAAVVAASGSMGTAGFGAAGVVVLGGGLVFSHRVGVDVGGLLLFVAVLSSSVATGSIVIPVLGTIATILAWDLGHGAVDLGTQLGREASTLRLEFILTLASVTVGLTVATMGYVVLVFGQFGQSNAALAALLIAALFATMALGHWFRQGQLPSEWMGPEG